MVPMQLNGNDLPWRRHVSIRQCICSFWDYSRQSVQELAIQSGHRVHPKTLWRWLRMSEVWSETDAKPLLEMVERALGAPSGSSWPALSGAIAYLDDKIFDLLVSRFHHPNGADLGALSRRIGKVGVAHWHWMGALPPLFLLPERPLRKLLKALIGDCLARRHLLTALVAFWNDERQRFLDADSGPDSVRCWLAPCAVLNGMFASQGPFSCWDDEDRELIHESLRFDAVTERAVTIQMLCGVAEGNLNSRPALNWSLGGGTHSVRQLAGELLYRSVRAADGFVQEEFLRFDGLEWDAWHDATESPQSNASSLALLDAIAMARSSAVGAAAPPESLERCRCGLRQ